MTFYNDDSSFPKKISVAELQQHATRRAGVLRAQGLELEPALASSRKITTTFWGQAWCKNLENYRDYESRLPRGRSYLRHGAVIDLKILSSRIKALVSGSELYEIEIDIKKIADDRWQKTIEDCSSSIGGILELMSGNLSHEVMGRITDVDNGLFPSPDEINMQCNCLDWSDICKHLAAVMYGVGVRLDKEPSLFFKLRGVDYSELVSKSSRSLGRQVDSDVANLDIDELQQLFGIDITL